jgi:hypothetical protein
MSSGIWPLFSVIIGSLAALGCLFGAFRALRHKRLIDDLPTSRTQGVFIGMAELKGTAESENPLTSYLAEVRCVQYRWQVDEQWRRTVSHTTTDAKGHTTTHTRTETGWNRVAGEEKSIPFYLKDDTGVIRIVPDGADIKSITTFNETCSPSSPLYYGKAPAAGIANSTHRRRFIETSIPLHAMLYVMGQTREREDVVAAEVARDKDAAMFLISTKTEKQISSSYSLWFWLWMVFGAILALAGAVLWSILGHSSSGPGLPLVIGAGSFLLALFLGWLWTVYNSLVNLHHRAEQGWSQVDIQLLRRHDLIPNIVKAVEGYRQYESETQQAVTEIRARAEAAGAASRGVAPLLRLIAERYPELKASDSFLKLQQTLVDTEQRIALARDYYNDIATFYNTRLQIIPDRFVVPLVGLRPRSLMTAADFERAPVKVNLAS